jgi:hypothetical protein
MSISDSPRFINTPTLLEEYNEDKKGYDQAVDDDTVIALSREYDTVSGNEEFYKAVFSHISLPSIDVVSGNEAGFMDSIKKGLSAVIQSVKDFFKWLFSFFTGKKEIAGRKSVSLELSIDKHGVNTDEIPYPLGFGDIYNKTGIPAANLGWMDSALGDCEKAVKKIEDYIEVMKKGCQAITEAGFQKVNDDGAGAVKKEHDALLVAAQNALAIEKLNTPSTLYGRVDFQMDGHGKLKEVPDPPLQGKNPKFKTDQSQVLHLLTKQKALLKAADSMLETSMHIERVSLKSLNSLMDFNKNIDVNGTKQFTAAANEVQATVRVVMGNLKMLQTAVYKSIFAAQSVLNATINKG